MSPSYVQSLSLKVCKSSTSEDSTIQDRIVGCVQPSSTPRSTGSLAKPSPFVAHGLIERVPQPVGIGDLALAADTGPNRDLLGDLLDIVFQLKSSGDNVPAS